MTINIDARLIKSSNFEAVILTSENIPMATVEHIKKKGDSLVLVSEDAEFEMKGSLTGLETVYFLSASQAGNVREVAPKRLQWAS